MMREHVSDVAFTPMVKEAQARLGSRAGYEKMEAKGGWQDKVTPELAAFIAERDSAYLATATADGQPYIQHRGGPKGFIKVIDDQTLALADFSGNRQYISLGNLAENDKAHLFLMDYANRRRIKIWGRARMVEDDPNLAKELADPNYKANPERALVFKIEAWDVNCPQHITPRFTQDDIEPAIGSLKARIAQLETELAEARGDQAGTPPTPSAQLTRTGE